MITILPLPKEELDKLRCSRKDIDDLLVMADRGEKLGSVGVRVVHSVLEMTSLEVVPEDEAERRFCADSLLRAAASYAANQGAYRLSCCLAEWESFLKSEGFRREDGCFQLATDEVVKFCKH